LLVYDARLAALDLIKGNLEFFHPDADLAEIVDLLDGFDRM